MRLAAENATTKYLLVETFQLFACLIWTLIGPYLTIQSLYFYLQVPLSFVVENADCALGNKWMDKKESMIFEHKPQISV
jgi:hypothetical protein